MANIKYLKSLKPYAITLYTGRTDIPTCLLVSPIQNSLLLYTDIVNMDSTSTNYNVNLINQYISNNILTEILLPADVEVPSIPTPPSGPQFLIIQAPGNIL